MPFDRPSCLFLDFFGTLVEYDANWTELHSYTDSHAACVALGADLTYEVFIDKWSAAWSLFERERVDLNLVLLGETAEGHHIGNARHLQNPRSDHPILKLTQLDLVVFLRRFQAVPVKLPNGRGQGPKRWRRAVR